MKVDPRPSGLTQPRRQNKRPWRLCWYDGIAGDCRPAASWCSGLASRPFFVVFVLESYPFLAITSPVPSDNLVVEGWIHEYAMLEAAAEYATIGTFYDWWSDHKQGRLY